MKLRTLFGAVQDSARKHGVPAALHDLGCRVLNRIAGFQILKGMSVRVQDVKDPALFDAGRFEARFAGEGELAALARDGAHDFSPEFLRDARARGDRCYALFDGAALVAYGWYSCLPTPIDERFVLHFDPAWTYMYKGYTVPAYRGRRLHAVGMCRALRAFTEEGRKGLVSYVASNNFASLHSVRRMGYEVFGEAYLFRAGGHSFAFSTPGCRRYGFRVEGPAGGAVWVRQGV